MLTMKKRKLSALICAIMLIFSMTMQAKLRLVVTAASKGTEYIDNGHKYSLDRGTPLTMETMIYIPYNGSLTFVEEASNNEYTIKSIGWATLEEKLADSNRSVLTQTKDYVKSVLAQVRKKPNVKKPYYSDPATVTREKFVKKDDGLSGSVKEGNGQRKPRTKAEEFRDSVLRAHNRFRDSVLSSHKEFRDSVLLAYEELRKKHYEDYAKSVREAWKHFKQEAPVPVPEEEKVMPILSPNADAETASWFGDQLKRIFRKKKKNESQQASNKDVTPKPVEKPKIISKQNVQLAYDVVLSLPDSIDAKQPESQYEVIELVENSNDYMVFDLFGTKCRVRTGDNCRFKLPSVNEKDLVDAITRFSGPQFNNMLYDCLQERKKHSFSDWAYYQMLLALTNHFYGEDTNEATLALGFLYSESGYKMRFAHDGSKLYMLVASDYMLYSKPYYYIGGDSYFLLNGNCDGGLYICNQVFQKESSLSLQISAVQDLSENLSVERTITSQRYDDFSFTIKSNMNYIDFYDTYPPSAINNNFMTKWAMYANTPLEKGVREQLYPQMEEKLSGLSKVEAVQRLLNWVQTGFKYKLDEEVWGWDRAFFGEESLFYPYCDCEDRSILLSHLVRDLLRLDVVLVYYPGHLAMAVDFKEDVDGVYYLYDNRKFVVCDPTIIVGDVGEAAYEEGTTTSLILLDKTSESN